MNWSIMYKYYSNGVVMVGPVLLLVKSISPANAVTYPKMSFICQREHRC